MQKWFSYPLTLLFFIGFGLALLVFHPIQWFCLKVWGYEAHKHSVTLVNWCVLQCTRILGTRYRFKNPYNLPVDRPLIFVANHQSLYDIPLIIWYLRKYHPKFVSKIELGKGIPSVSFALKHGGSALIDRKNSKQSIAALKKLAVYIENHRRSAVIFPEGTRSRNGVPGKFRTTGLKILMQQAPSARIVPLTINNSWKLLRFGKFPMGLGAYLELKVHPPVENTGNPDVLIAEIEKQITDSVALK